MILTREIGKDAARGHPAASPPNQLQFLLCRFDARMNKQPNPAKKDENMKSYHLEIMDNLPTRPSCWHWME